MTPSRTTLAAAAAAAALAALPATAHAAGRTRVGTRDVVASGAQALGAAAADAPVHVLVGLRHRDEDQLKAAIAAVSDPSSPQYGHYLSEGGFVARYAPTTATVGSVEDYLRSTGLKIDSVPQNRAFVEVSGTVAQAESAFGVQLERYRLEGGTVQAPLSAVSLPSALAGVITGVSGLDTSDVAHPNASPPPAYVNAAPCSSYWGEKTASDQPDVNGEKVPYVPCGYTPEQLQGAYGMAPAIAAGLDGTGQTVAIIDAYSSPIIASDVATYSSKHGLPAPDITLNDTPVEENTPEGASVPSDDLPVIGVLPGAGLNLVDPQGWAGEETLDFEAVHAMAPKAKLLYYGAESPQGTALEMAQNDVVTDDKAQIITNSYGGTSDTTDATSDGYWMQAAMQGQGVYFSSGDSGDETMGSGSTADRTVDGDGNSPYVTSVGGTTLAVGPNDDYEFETYWGTYSSLLTNGAFPTPSYNSGGGGGTSEVYAQPDYQKGVVPDRLASFWANDKNKADGALIPGRVTPDVAMLGDPNSGFLMGQVQDFDQYANPGNLPLPIDATSYSEYRIGGTSLSSPLFAGVMALADQAAGMHHGFADPALYKAGGDAFHDVTAPAKPVSVIRVNNTNGTNDDDGTQTFLRTAGNTQTLSSVPGYDDSTGLGSPNGLSFLRALAPGSALIPADPAATTTPPASASPTSTLTPAPGSASTPSATTPGAATTSTAKACTPPSRFVYHLHAAKGQRVVSAVLSIGGRKKITRKGRRLTKITLRRPAGTTFTVRIRTLSSTGAIKTSTRTYTLSGCHVGATKTRDTHA